MDYTHLKYQLLIIFFLFTVTKFIITIILLLL